MKQQARHFRKTRSFSSVLGLVLLSACDLSPARKTSPPPPAPSAQHKAEIAASPASPPLQTNGQKQDSDKSPLKPAEALQKLPNIDKARPALVQTKESGDKNYAPHWTKHVKVRSKFGVVSSVENHATQAGIEILEAGGNAVDAAIATAFALAVTHPSAGNIGGGGFMLLRMGEEVDAIDFREDAPLAMSEQAFWKMIKEGGRGPTSVGVPGTVAGLYLAHKRRGTLPWKRLVEPAIHLAKNGYKLGLRQAQTLIWAQHAFIKDKTARQTFYQQQVKEGGRISQPLMAETLSLIAEKGKDGFYQGAVAEDLVETLGEQALLSLDDLKKYEAKIREPLFFDFYGFRVITMPPPSAGGVALTQNLLMLQALQVDKTPANSAERLHLVAEVSRRSQVERQLFVVAPEALSAEAQQQARERSLSAQTWLKEHPVDPQKVSLSASIHPSYQYALAELPHTTHFSVIDQAGNLVSCTVTLSGSYGSRIMGKKSGVVLNNSAASFSARGVNTPKAGQRTVSSMAPSLALLGTQHALVLGSPGGNTIPNTITQVFLPLALEGSSLRSAVDQPRVHQDFAPQHLQSERSRPLPAGIKDQLNQMGHNVQGGSYTIGDANIAAWINGESFAVSDHREGGLALGAQKPKRTETQTEGPVAP